MAKARDKQRERFVRARERQLEYQETKAASLTDPAATVRPHFLQTQALRARLNAVRHITPADRLIEVGSGAHGHVFWFGCTHSVGIDPLACQYKRLFPDWQDKAATIAAEGERLPFSDASFDIAISDNVIDHAERPLAILDEIVRVLRPGGLLYFTVNVHHPVYDIASRMHGIWNAAGIKVELSAFADHTVHFTESAIREAISRLPLDPIEQSSNVDEVRRAQRSAAKLGPDPLLKALFFKNATYELIAIRR